MKLLQYLYNRGMRIGLLTLVLLGVLGLGALLVPAVVAANNYGAGNYNACQYGSCSITLGTSATVNLNVTPTVTGLCTTQSDTVTVTTDNSNGYSLTLADTAVSASLLSGANSIAAAPGTQATPLVLAASSWGYRVDSLGGFGAGPTSSGNNLAPSALKFAGVPGSASPNTIANTSSPASSGQATLVWYAVCANTTVINGSYTTQVTYSAVTN